MGITHVIRGEEWINSVPKHLKLYEHFAWEPPIFCHLPLLRNNDASKSKLSKRKNPTAINYYRRAGFLPEALRNFLGMMGWLMPNGAEKFSLEEMIGNFRLEDISLGGPVFDVAKLRWLNARYIREDYTPQTLRQLMESWALNAQRIEQIIPLVQPRLETLADWGYLAAAFFADEVPLDPDAIEMKGKSREEMVPILQMTLWRLEQQQDFSAPALDGLFREMADAFEIKLRQLTQPLFVAMSGRRAWTPLFDSMEILGPDMVRMRLRRAIAALGGMSAKQRKKLEKEYARLFGRRD
jgi:glutamyl-tRNA synthetase